jgi:5-methylcytosine-specific restriction endonuclease McrA
MSIDIDRYRESFKSHLEKSGHKDPTSQDNLINFIEGELAYFIKSHFIGDLESIYSLTKADFFNAVMREIALNDSFKADDEKYGGMLIKSIKVYTGFLGSKWHPSRTKIKLGKGERKKNTTAQPQEAKPKPVIAKKIKLVEGAILQERDREIHKRNPKLRELCIKHYGDEYRCLICEMNFVERYGEIGKEFIEVHHLNPISETDGEHEVNPATDLIPLCSNCHSMIHRLEDPSDWQLLKTYLADQNVTNE